MTSLRKPSILVFLLWRGVQKGTQLGVQFGGPRFVSRDHITGSSLELIEKTPPPPWLPLLVPVQYWQYEYGLLSMYAYTALCLRWLRKGSNLHLFKSLQDFLPLAEVSEEQL